MLKAGLCLNYDPTVANIEAAVRIELSPAGQQHLYWASNFVYVEAMAEVTPLLDEPTYQVVADSVPIA
jgi:hypothetical protein